MITKQSTTAIVATIEDPEDTSDDSEGEPAMVE